MSIKLNLEDRYYISMYARKLACTVRLRFAIDVFFDQINISGDEVEKYGINIDPIEGTFSCNDLNYVIEYEKFPDAVIDAMKHYISVYDVEQTKDNELIRRIIKYFNKLL
jgi:hypothetical protein